MPRRSLGGQIGLLLAFLAGSFLAYHNTLGAFFVTDDFSIIHGADKVRLAPRSSGMWRPVLSLSWHVDYLWAGLNPIGYHVTNTVLHALNSLAVYGIALALLRGSRLLAKGGRGLALAAGALFLLLPSHAEPVSWIAGRNDLLSAFFGLYALLTYLLHKQSGRWSFLVVSLLLCACGFLSKESILSFPLVILLLELFYRRSRETGPGKRGSRTWIHVSGLYFLVLGVYLAVRLAVIGTLLGGYGPEVHQDLDLTGLASATYTQTIRTFLPPIRSGGLRIGLLAALALAALGAGLYASLVRKRAWPVEGTLALVLFYAALLPAANLRVSVDFPVGERMLYWPSAFFALFLAVLVWHVAGSARAAGILLGSILVCYAATLHRSNEQWRCMGESSRQLAMCVRDKYVADEDYQSGEFPDRFVACLRTSLEAASREMPEYCYAFVLRRHLPRKESRDCILSGRDDCLDRLRYRLSQGGERRALAPLLRLAPARSSED
jgi:hypothetical protein